MQKVFLIVLLLMKYRECNAQETVKSDKTSSIKAIVTDSISGTPLEYATVSIFLRESKKATTGAITDRSGIFTLDVPAPGTYNLTIEFIGYQSKTLRNIIVDKNTPFVDLNRIGLSKKGSTLESVTITAQKGLIENRIDKVVFNAEKDLTSQSGVATDILKKVPQVSVDIDGNVELAGSSSIRFLINGKPSSAFGNNIADVLQSIPASQIKSIEVITNPGAKYDAEGLGGIINIILRQNSAKGINGNISLTAGTRMENGSFNLNARQGDFGMHAFVSGNARLPSTTPISSIRLSSDTASRTNVMFAQDGSSRFRRHGIESGIGFDWTYLKKNTFSGALNYDNFGNTGNGSLNQSQVTTDQGSGNVLSDLLTSNHTANSFLFQNVDASLSYKRTFSKEGQELSASINTSFGNNHATVDNYQLQLPGDSLFYGTQSVNPGKEQETEIQTDYTLPIKKDVIFGTGGKMNFRDISSRSDVLSLQPDTKDYAYDSSLSNHLTYHQKVYALYAELTFPVGNLFDAKIGGRYERTDIQSFYSNAAQQAATPGYSTFVPSVFFSKKLPSNQTIKLSYSRRIERPDYRDLNPFINTSDPKNITAGNPYLQPEIGNRFELGYSRDINQVGSFMINAFYRTSDHDIQPYIVYYPSLPVGDSVFTNVAVSTRQNIGLEKNAGVNLFADLHVNSKFTIRLNTFIFQRHTINSLDPGHNSNSFNYRFNLNAAYQFKHDLAAEFFGNFNSARNEVQGKYPSFTSYSIAFRKQCWNKKGSVALIATNPFNQYVNQRTSVFGPNFTVNSIRKVPFRSIGINFTWKFGRLEFKKDKEDNKENNTPMPEGQGG